MTPKEKAQELLNKYDTQQHIIVWIMILIPLLCLFLCD